MRTCLINHLKNLSVGDYKSLRKILAGLKHMGIGLPVMCLWTRRLEEVCRDIVLKYQDTFSEFDSIPDDIWSYISNEVATYFDVNPPVIEAQIKKENITQKIPIRKKKL